VRPRCGGLSVEGSYCLLNDRTDSLAHSPTAAMMKTALVLAALSALASAHMPYQFGDGYQFVVGEPQRSFDCEGRQYGYYADVANFCQVFHVCVPIEDDFGQIIQTAQFSFICGNQTVFNQQTLTCDHAGDAFPCEQAESLYSRNDLFGRIDEEF